MITVRLYNTYERDTIKPMALYICVYISPKREQNPHFAIHLEYLLTKLPYQFNYLPVAIHCITSTETSLYACNNWYTHIQCIRTRQIKTNDINNYKLYTHRS